METQSSATGRIMNTESAKNTATYEWEDV